MRATCEIQQRRWVSDKLNSNDRPRALLKSPSFELFRRRGVILAFALLTLVMLVLLLRGCPETEDAYEDFTPPFQLPDEVDVSHLSLIAESRLEDLHALLERRTIRALVVRSKTFYFFEGAQQRGLSYEMLKAFEEFLNARLEQGALPVNVVFVPVTRDQIIPALRQGYGDIAVADLTITPSRLSQVNFSVPVYEDVRELVVLGPSSPDIESRDDLAGKVFYTRASSSYYESLLQLSAAFEDEDKPPITINIVDEHLEDEELLEMVDAGILPGIVMDSHTAEFWSKVFEDVEVRSDLVVRDGANIAWAFNHKMPKLEAAVNEFLASHGRGSLVGNMLFRRYLERTDYLDKALHSSELKKFHDTAHLFQRYADRYDFDWLMVISQAYQESRLDHTVVSDAGAVGIMQVLPETAADKNVDIDDITVLENNIHAGNKYLRHVRDTYFESEPMDDLNKTLFSFAAYNAGPNRISRLRNEAERRGLDRNIWFDNVEVIAARRIGRETVDYVSNIYKYWVAFTLSRDRLTRSANQAFVLEGAALNEESP